jgi:hypothetical protein
VYVNETPPESFYNVPFMLAYAVLDQVLTEFMHQGIFKCRDRNRSMLGEKMNASRPSVRWQDYDLIEKGKFARNELAHEAKIVDRANCFIFIDAIERELKTWSVI